MPLDLTHDLAAALREAREDIAELVRFVIREELARFHATGDPNELPDADATARLLGMTASSLRRSAERGRCVIPVIRLSRRLRWRRGDVLGFIANRGKDSGVIMPDPFRHLQS